MFYSKFAEYNYGMVNNIVFLATFLWVIAGFSLIILWKDYMPESWSGDGKPWCFEASTMYGSILGVLVLVIIIMSYATRKLVKKDSELRIMRERIDRMSGSVRHSESILRSNSENVSFV